MCLIGLYLDRHLGSSEVDEWKSILFAKVGGEIQDTVGDEAGNPPTGGGSQEVFNILMSTNVVYCKLNKSHSQI